MLADRRIHKVFVTRNTEYHLRRDRCVAVVDRRTGDFVSDHAALHQRAVAAVERMANGSYRIQMTLPAPGESLLFEGSGSILTGPVVSVERPPRPTVDTYPSDDTRP
jgi:hypothetical protein